VGSRAPIDPNAPGADAVALILEADGWFWPVGAPPESGVAIGEIRLRGAALPILIEPALPRITAGGPAIVLTLRIGQAGALRLTNGATALPFGSIAVAVFAPGGKPGTGTLTGGVPGATGVRLIDATSGSADVSYTPAANPGTDTLVVALDDGAGGQGIELGRFPLVVRGA
jgi:hypothetical protein